MKNLCIVLISLIFMSCCAGDEESSFDAIIVPTVADKEMDYWSKVPLDSGPYVPITRVIYRNEPVSLLVFCKVRGIESQKQVDISYDLKIYSGKRIPMNEVNIPFYKGEVPRGLLLPGSVIDAAFDENEPFGSYCIEAVMHENISKRSYTAKETVELVEFSKPKEFASKEEYGKWVTEYYGNPDPVRSFAGIVQYVETDDKWIKEYPSILGFHRRILLDNPFLWQYLAKFYDSVGTEEKKRILLITAVTDCNERQIIQKRITPDMKQVYDKFLTIQMPLTSGRISTANQLDMQWSDFFASGKYEPINRIVSALALYEYQGTLEKIKRGELRADTKLVERKAMLDAVYQSAIWSIASNCKQHYLVYQYCQSIYEHEPLDPQVKKKLGTILYMVEKQKRENEKKPDTNDKPQS